MVGPMTEGGHGMRTGRSMPEGMGMIRQARALGDSLGSSLGRALGVGSEQERAVTHARLGAPMSAMQDQHPPASDVAQVPGFPQDMFMAMDEMVDKPETRGLRPTWTGGMMGMMTMVRVLEPERYDAIQAEIVAARREAE
jgi:hypothetical protein